jgi:hypothetical protein
MIRKSARQINYNFRALFVVYLALLLSSTTAWSDGNPEFRVAAIIAAGERSRALVEHADGQQDWYRVGDSLDQSLILGIDEEGITITTADGPYRLLLRGDSKRVAASSVVEDVPPPQHQSRQVQFLGLLSRVKAVDPVDDETYEQALARNMNQSLGFGKSARIVGIGRVEVTTPTQAHQELQRQLALDEPIRITVENDYVKDIYLLPD